MAGVSLAEFNAMELDFLFRLDFRARCTLSELAAGLREMEALASGHSAPATLPTLCAAEAEEAAAAAAACALPADAAASDCCGSAAMPAAAAAALVACRDSAAEQGEGEDSCSDATTVAALCRSPADHGFEEQGAARRRVVPPALWTHAAAAVPAEEAEGPTSRAAPQRRSKKRCSMEAQHILCGGAEERPRLVQSDCCA